MNTPSIFTMIALAITSTFDLNATLIFDESFKNLTISTNIHEVVKNEGQWLQLIGRETSVKIKDTTLRYGDLRTQGAHWQQSRPSRLVYNFDISATGPFTKQLGTNDFIGKPGTTLYVGFIFQSTGGMDRHNQITLGARRFDDDEGGNRITLLHDTKGRFQLNILPSNQYYPYIHDLGEASDQVELFVLRIDFQDSGSDHLTIWRNPPLNTKKIPKPSLQLDHFPSPRPDSEDPRLADRPHSLAFNQLLRYSGPIRMKDARNGSYLRNSPLRIGTTWHSVLPDFR